MEREAEARAREKKEAAAAGQEGRARRRPGRGRPAAGRPSPPRLRRQGEAAAAKPCAKPSPPKAAHPLPPEEEAGEEAGGARAQAATQEKEVRRGDQDAAGFSRESSSPTPSAQRPEYERVLEKIVEIPSVSVEPAAQGRGPPRRRVRRVAARVLRRQGQALRDEGPPHRLRPLRPATDLPDGHRLQPPRRPAGRGPGLEDVALRLRPGGRPLLRARHDRRQGPGDHGALRRALRRRAERRPVNIHFLWELEEEIGSPHFETTIRANAKEFATRLGRRLRHRLGLARRARRRRRACAACRASASSSRRARPTSTPAPRAARRATR